MSALRELQQGMMDRILREKDAAGLPIAADPPFTPDQRLGVYKNNTHMLLRDLLKDTFPVTTVLLGEEFMAYAVHEFVGVAPPEGGDMNAYGADFPEFLGHMPNINKFAYVPDVARLEWLAYEAYMSPRGPEITGQDLNTIPDPMTLQLYLQPHVHLLRSGWPVDKLWSRVNEEGTELKDFEMKPAETFAAIFRVGDKISVWSITEGGYRFLENLQSGPSFALAADAAFRAEPELALDQLLAALLQQGLLVKHQG